MVGLRASDGDLRGLEALSGQGTLREAPHGTKWPTAGSRGGLSEVRSA